MAHGVGRLAYRRRRARLPAPQLRIFFGAYDYPLHRFDGLYRVFASRRLAGEHDGVGPVDHRVSHVVCLGARRPRVAYHRIEHLGRDYHRFALHTAFFDDLLLDHRHVLRIHLDAKVAPRHHHPVDDRQDFVDIFHGLARLHLRDYFRLRAGSFQDAAHLDNVLPVADEGYRDVVHVMGRAPEKVRDVLFRKRRNGEVRSRDVDALALPELAAHDHTADDSFRRRLFDLEVYRPVVDEDRLSPLHFVRKRRIIDVNAVFVPLTFIKKEGEEAVSLQCDLAVAGKLSRAYLRSFGVEQHRDRQLPLLFHGPDVVQSPLVGSVIAVAEVQARDIHAGLRHFEEGVIFPTGGADRTDYLHLAFHLIHLSYLSQFFPLSISPCAVITLARPRIFIAEICSVNWAIQTSPSSSFSV
ncbi:hypothetical protein SDC9_124776 [bioreactor metagenome]|uniref:Uncharacterized protein n=1 Tax=bioreactor metagenome TaxID=1076179 RepID=A0A645CLK4_9ZZZZ